MQPYAEIDHPKYEGGAAPQHSVAFMLAAYNRISALYLGQVERGERRVEFFITFSAAVLGALVLLSQVTLAPQVYVAITVGSMVILELYGLMTLTRLSNRKITMKFHMDRMDSIQDYFVKLDPEIALFLKAKASPSASKIGGTPVVRRTVRRLLALSGLIETLVMFNSVSFTVLILALFAAYRGYAVSMAEFAAVGAVAFVMWSLVQLAISKAIAPYSAIIER